MKKIFVLATLLCCFSAASFAQATVFRQLRQDEIDFYKNVHNVMYDALPHPFQDWTGVGDERELDVIKFFCPYMEPQCVGKTDTRLGKKDAYTLIYSIDYAMPGHSHDSLAGASMSLIKDFNNAQQIAASLKMMRQDKLHISITVNMDAPTTEVYPFVYCSKTPVETLHIPVPTTLAVLGQRSASCPIMEDGRAVMSPTGDAYRDDALVFLGKPVSLKKSGDDGDGLIITKYSLGFDITKIGLLKVQNIVVEFKGDAQVIKDVIKQINWAKLNDLLAH